MTEQTQPTDAELEACPFCGNANAIVYDDLLTFHAGCLSCGATGSVSSYRNGAIAAWNRRAVLAKWGTPAGAGEPVAEFDEWFGRPVLLHGAPMLKHKQKLYTTPQPTQAQAGAVPTRAFLERTLAAMEGVIDVADRKTDEFDALRSCVIDLTLMLFKPEQQDTQQHVAVPLTDEWIDAAAKKLAECMEYPWEFMPEPGRKNMRKHAQDVIGAAYPLRGKQ